MSNILDIDALVEPLAILYNALDTELFLSIISELDIDIDDGGTEEWLQEKISKAKIVEKANATTIQKYTRLIIPEMNKIYKAIIPESIKPTIIPVIVHLIKLRPFMKIFNKKDRRIYGL